MSRRYVRLEQRVGQLSLRFWIVFSCLVCTLFFALFQGGKLAFMLLFISLAISIYLGLGKWSGIVKTNGSRTLLQMQNELVIEAGTSLAVKIEVQIPGFWPIPYLFIKDCLVRQNGESELFETSVIPDWKRCGSVEYRTRPLRRGFYHFGQTNCTTEDIFGLFEHTGQLELPQNFSVLPQKIVIKEWKQLHQMLKGMHHHSTTTRAMRETTQINGVREYNYGDRLSRIHWRATAKTGTWKSKEYEKESLPKTIIVLDRQLKHYRSKDQFELAVSVAASLLEYGANQNLALGLLSVGSDSIYFEPKRSKSQQKMMLNHLTGVEADGSYSLLQVLNDRSRGFVPGTFIALISPQKGEKLLQTMGWINQRQMNPCHMWICSNENDNEQEGWIKRLHASAFLGYPIQSLPELSFVLGGRG